MTTIDKFTECYVPNPPKIKSVSIKRKKWLQYQVDHEIWEAINHLIRYKQPHSRL